MILDNLLKNAVVYKVKKGEHDFKPNLFSQFRPVFGDFEYTLILKLSEDCWYDPTSFSCESSWNKGGGMRNWIGPNNKNSFHLAWVPVFSESKDTFKATIYINDKDKKWSVPENSEMLFRLGEFPIMTITRKGKDISVTAAIGKISEDGELFTDRTSYDQSNYPYGAMSFVGLWFGGKCAAPQDMKIRAAWSKGTFLT